MGNSICLQFQIKHSHLNIFFICSEAIVIKKYGALISTFYVFGRTHNEL